MPIRTFDFGPDPKPLQWVEKVVGGFVPESEQQIGDCIEHRRLAGLVRSVNDVEVTLAGSLESGHAVGKMAVGNQMQGVEAQGSVLPRETRKREIRRLDQALLQPGTIGGPALSALVKHLRGKTLGQGRYLLE
jgi:hypothetical protein